VSIFFFLFNCYVFLHSICLMKCFELYFEIFEYHYLNFHELIFEF
jgi:hypothetical protein